MTNEEVTHQNIGDSLQVKHKRIFAESIWLLLLAGLLLMICTGMALGFGYVVGYRLGEMRTTSAIQAGEPYMSINYTGIESCVRLWVMYEDKRMDWKGCTPTDGLTLEKYD